MIIFWLTFTSPGFAAGTSKIEMPEVNWDYGQIKEGAIVKHEFWIKNTGTAELIISAAIVSCECSTAVLSRERIAPGKTGKLKVTFNSKDKKGFSSNTIKVCSNDPEKPYLRVRFWGTVVKN